MNSDIKKFLDILNETSAGGTSSGSIASVAQPMQTERRMNPSVYPESKSDGECPRCHEKKCKCDEMETESRKAPAAPEFSLWGNAPGSSKHKPHHTRTGKKKTAEARLRDRLNKLIEETKQIDELECGAGQRKLRLAEKDVTEVANPNRFDPRASRRHPGAVDENIGKALGNTRIGKGFKKIKKGLGRAMAGWGPEGIGDQMVGSPHAVVHRNKAYDTETLKGLQAAREHDPASRPGHTSPRGLQNKVVDRELKKRGVQEESVEEGASDLIKGAKRFIKGKPSRNQVISKHNSASSGAQSRSDVFKALNDKERAAAEANLAGREKQKAERIAKLAPATVNEKAPPGEEKLVRKLKKEYPGHPEKAFATAYAIKNKTVKHKGKK